MFFTAVKPMYAGQDLEEVQYDLDKHGVQKYLEISPKYRILVQSEARSKKRIAVPSNPIARNRPFNTLPAICIEKVVYMKTGEELYCKVHQTPRLPRTSGSC